MRSPLDGRKLPNTHTLTVIFEGTEREVEAGWLALSDFIANTGLDVREARRETLPLTTERK